jgi:hypothetical protein
MKRQVRNKTNIEKIMIRNIKIIAVLFFITVKLYSQQLIVNYENLPNDPFDGYKKPIGLAILKFEGSETFHQEIFDALRKISSVKQDFMLYSVAALDQMKNLKLTSLNPSDSTVRESLRDNLEIELVITGTMNNDGSILCEIKKTSNGDNLVQLEFKSSVSSNPLSDLVIFVSKKKKPVYTVKPLIGSLEIKSQPVDTAVVYLNGELMGTTPLTLQKILAGEYSLKVSKESYHDHEESVVIIDGQTTSKSVRLNLKDGDLLITAADSRIYIDGKFVGNNSATSHLAPGKYVVRAEKSELYDPDEKEVTLIGGKQSVVTLEPQIKTGVVYLSTIPQDGPSTDLYINNTKKGNAPMSLSLQIGNYSLMAKKSGYTDISQLFIVKDKDKQNITIDFQSNEAVLESIRNRWGTYKWISAGTAVLSGAALYFFNNQANLKYSEYQKASTPEAATSARNNVNSNVTYKNVAIGVLMTAGATFLISWIVQSSY